MIKVLASASVGVGAGVGSGFSMGSSFLQPAKNKEMMVANTNNFLVFIFFDILVSIKEISFFALFPSHLQILRGHLSKI
jgi:F0F1-type ATP synthase membrane subunit c/vacuolar-type H+-ATPase subunit K